MKICHLIARWKKRSIEFGNFADEGKIEELNLCPSVKE